MATFSDDARFADLISALKLVAAEPAQQRELLTELQVVAREILRGDAIELIDETLLREGVIPAQVAALVERIDELFDQLLAREHELSSAALSEAEEWHAMRVLAREALEMLGLGPLGDERGPTRDGDKSPALD